jgi:toxin ParE1/3/4
LQGTDGIVRNPRHFIVYRRRTPDLVTVLRVLHDAMDLARHLEGAGEDP